MQGRTMAHKYQGQSHQLQLYLQIQLDLLAIHHRLVNPILSSQGDHLVETPIIKSNNPRVVLKLVIAKSVRHVMDAIEAEMH